MATILVAGMFHEAGLSLFRNRSDIDLIYIDDRESGSLRLNLVEAEGVVLRTQPFGSAELDAAPKLRVASRVGVGYDSVDVPALTARGVRLTIVGDTNAVSVAEHTLAMILACARNLRLHDQSVREGRWDIRDELKTFELFGKTVLIVGLGRIGTRLVPLVKALNMEVLAFDPMRSTWHDLEDSVEQVDDLHVAVRRSHVVSIHAPKLSDKPLFDAELIRSMRPGSILINAARGGMVDELALVDALNTGHLFGAGLDVFGSEPPDPENPLLKQTSVHLSPHNATSTPECAARMADRAARNVLEFLDNTLDQKYIVNP